MLSVIFSTYNGDKKLRRTLDSLINQNCNFNWELLVVDNGSQDETSAILQEYKKLLPLTILYEAKQGKNAALNHALRFCKYDLVLFTDDDVRAEKNWLRNVKQTADSEPEFDIIGGLIKPEWEAAPDEWIIKWAPLGALYAINEESESGPCKPGKVWGPNMLVRKRVFTEGNLLFNENIGPDGTDFYPMGSETEFTTRAENLGYKCFFSRNFLVFHWIPIQSLNKSWILNRAQRLGRGVTVAKINSLNVIDGFNYKFKALVYSLLSKLHELYMSKRSFWWAYKHRYFLGCKEAFYKFK